MDDDVDGDDCDLVHLRFAPLISDYYCPMNIYIDHGLCLCLGLDLFHGPKM